MGLVEDKLNLLNKVFYNNLVLYEYEKYMEDNFPCPLSVEEFLIESNLMNGKRVQLSVGLNVVKYVGEDEFKEKFFHFYLMYIDEDYYIVPFEDTVKISKAVLISPKDLLTYVKNTYIPLSLYTFFDLNNKFSSYILIDN